MLFFVSDHSLQSTGPSNCSSRPTKFKMTTEYSIRLNSPFWNIDIREYYNNLEVYLIINQYLAKLKQFLTEEIHSRIRYLRNIGEKINDYSWTLFQKQFDLVDSLEFAELDRTHVKRHAEKYLERFIEKFTAVTLDMLLHIDGDMDKKEDISGIFSPADNNTFEEQFRRRETSRTAEMDKYTRTYAVDIEICLNASKFLASNIQSGGFGQYLAFFRRLTRKIEDNQKTIEAQENVQSAGRLVSKNQYFISTAKLFTVHFFKAFFDGDSVSHTHLVQLMDIIRDGSSELKALL
jgi:hypothetical protein